MTLVVTPLFISFLFEIRSELRNQEKENLSPTEFVFGRLIGRFSSFSNSAIILQNSSYFFINAQTLDDYYFQKQALGGVLSQNLIPKNRPESMLYQLYGFSEIDNISYMCGTQGNLYISLMKSFKTLIINVISILTMIFLTFYLARKLRFVYKNEFAFILLSYVLLSGVANEYLFLVYSLFVFVVMFVVLNSLKNNIK